MKKSMLTLTAIAFVAMVITACGGSKPAGESSADTAAKSSQDPQQELDAALAAAATPGEKAEIYAKAIAEAKASAEALKLVAEKKAEAVAKAPSFTKKALQGELDKANADVAAANARFESLIAQAAKAAAVPVVETVVEAVTASEESEPAAAE